MLLFIRIQKSVIPVELMMERLLGKNHSLLHAVFLVCPPILKLPKLEIFAKLAAMLLSIVNVK